jgi:hypothetical protein
MDTLVAFARQPSELYDFVARPSIASYTLTITFPFTCPEHIIDVKLKDLAHKLFRRPITVDECDAVFQRVISPMSTIREGIPKISNSFRAKFGFFKEFDDEASHVFSTLCLIHLQHKSKLLDTDTNKATRISHATFSYFTDRNPKQKTKPPPWLVDIADSLKKSSEGSNTLLSESSDTPSIPDKPQEPRLPEASQQTEEPTTPRAAPAEVEQAHPTEPSSLSLVQPPSPFSITIEIDSELHLRQLDFSFIRHDYGQYVTLPDGSKHGNCCAALCLSEATSLTPAQLVEFFCMRAKMIADIDAVFQQRPSAADPWHEYVDCDGRRHLAEAFTFGLDQHWAANYTAGQLFDCFYLLALTPTEVRNTPIVIISDDSAFTKITIKDSLIDNCVLLFPPACPTAKNPPLFLLHRSNHFTVLKAPNPLDNERYFDTLKQLINPLAIRTHLPTNLIYIASPPTLRIICYNSSATDYLTLMSEHSLLLRTIQEQFSLDRPSLPTQANTNNSSPLGTLSQPIIIMDDDNQEGLDLVNMQRASSPAPPSLRSPSPSPNSSPAKSPSIGTTPPRDNGLGRTARTAILHQQPLSPTASPNLQLQSLSSQTSQISLQSQISNVSDIDLSEYVSKQGRKHLEDESRFAAPIQTPSLYSTGSIHQHLVPSGFDIPLCPNRHPLQFVRYCNNNHECDNADCHDRVIPNNSFGWRCSFCDVDYCTTCMPITWQPDTGSIESSLVESQRSSILSSPSPLPPTTGHHQQQTADLAPLRHQGVPDAAA